MGNHRASISSAKLPALNGLACMGKAPSHRRVRFGSFEMDEIAGELCKDGAKIRLQEQPFQILQILLEQPGEVVSREEIRKRVWPSDTFVDFDHGINNAINRLREALGDTAETPRFIETLPRRGYRFVATIDDQAPRMRSLAVLPLENLSRDPEQEYFTDGLTEALITSLAKIGALRVVSRTSAMHYKGVHRPVREIARELDVDAVVEGTVLRAGERVRISAQLIDGRSDTHIWAESYERSLRDVLALHSELAQAIAEQIQITLTPQEQAHFASSSRQVDPDAYEAYLKGRYHWNRRTGDGLPKAVRHFQEAITKDPSFAAAYSGLADGLSGLGIFGFVCPAESFGKAKDLALHALELDPGLSEARASLAWVTFWYDFDFPKAEREFERAIELNPRYVTAHGWFGFCLGLMGRFEEAYTECQRAVRLEPLSSAIQYHLGCVYWFGRRYDQAIEQLKKALDLDPNFPWSHGFLGFSYECKAMYQAALAVMQKVVELSPGSTLSLLALAEAYALAGKRGEALSTLKQLDELSKQQYVTPYFRARVHAALGEHDQAVHWLDTACRERAAITAFLKIDPWLEKLSSDPRFEDLLRRMNFPD